VNTQASERSVIDDVKKLHFVAGDLPPKLLLGVRGPPTPWRISTRR
jgi:hypothetical protein